MELREEYARRHGGALSLREFHQELLALGPIPLPSIRRLMFREAAPAQPEP